MIYQVDMLVDQEPEPDTSILAGTLTLNAETPEEAKLIATGLWAMGLCDEPAHHPIHITVTKVEEQ